MHEQDKLDKARKTVQMPEQIYRYNASSDYNLSTRWSKFACKKLDEVAGKKKTETPRTTVHDYKQKVSIHK